MKVRAYAKINLGLHVLGKRSDGYHSIETVFRLIDLYDDLEMVQNDQGIQFSSNRPELSDDNTNLCVRAAHVLRDLTGCHTGVEMKLTKRIPIGAGLGGGSADAAATLRGLTKLWSLDISPDELQTIGETLGSDVPFFFTGQTAFATGRGEILESFVLPLPYTILVATPPIHVSTAWAYSSLRLAENRKRPKLKELLSGNTRDIPTLRRELSNDFEATIFERHPEIAKLKEAFMSGGADIALMSGSGSSVFGLFSAAETARGLASDLSKQYFTSVTEPQFKPEIN
ncbi:MAG: 4-(cytidine 5'-diphospho)-2-C-methyl-D-erythritol kinase [Ignavibacteriales bacterium]|nr:4-(cytidine 5'-diphospho)-2-C-methyl-D-erythritol kinase [Ignavibacteriales bacterium]